MNYTEVQFKLSQSNINNEEILIAALASAGYESFWQDTDFLKAYIETKLFSKEIIEKIKTENTQLFSFTYTFDALGEKNWNEEWEKNFEPLLISDECYIRATFHDQKEVRFEIIIEPKMSFGTGHHSTTSLMVENILKMDIKGKSVLDMGCGTGILAILASKMQADKVLAIDNDKWAYENSIENIQNNNCSNIEVKLGDTTLIENKTFDVIFANINRNIILEDIHRYVASLNENGEIILSGFLSVDRQVILDETEKNNLKSIKFSIKNDWVSEIFTLIKKS